MKNAKMQWMLLLLILFRMPVSAQRPLYLDKHQPTEIRVNDLMSRMTLDEKIAQMDMFASWDVEAYTRKGIMESTGAGAFIADVDAEEMNRIQALSEKSRLKIPFLMGVDAAHGHAMKAGATVFPTSITMAASFNPGLVETAARHAAEEIRSYGNQWTFAPCVDIVHDARFGRTGETYGECPFLSSVLVRSAVRGLQNHPDPQKRVAACIKHLLGGGASVGGVNHGTAEISERMMRRDFLPPFKAAIDEGAMTIMPGHNDVNGIPVHASRQILTDIIKREYGFPGFYITDMCDVENLSTSGIHRITANHKEAVERSINAGIDMHMYSFKGQDRFIDYMKELVREGKVPVERVDDAVRRILTVKFELGLFENRYVDTRRKPDTKEAKAVALEAARQSIVLLKNKMLPLTSEKTKRILVTGPNADNHAIMGDWSGMQPEEHIVTVLEGIRDVAGRKFDVVYSPCGKIRGKKTSEATNTTDPATQARRIEEGGELNDYDIQQAVEKAKTCDVAVVVIGGYGLRYDWGMRTYGESSDRPSIDFYGRQVELVQKLHETGTPVVVMIVNGKPLNNPWVTEHATAIIDLFEPGMYGGQAAAEILFGMVNPSGKLPITIPRTAGHLPQYYYQTKSRYWTGYGLGSGREDDKPAFCFGHGLSYTTYRYGEVQLSDSVLHGDEALRITVPVTNEGKMDGYETVMAFVCDKVSSVVTPLKQLKAFKKVFVKSGETQMVELEIPFSEFGLWNEEMKYVVEPGEFDIYVGASADDVKATKTVVYAP